MAISVIFLGIFVMLAWGIGDFICAYRIKQIGTPKAMLISNIYHFAPVLLIFFYVIAANKFEINKSAFIILLAASIIDAFAWYFFFKSLEIGEVSIVSPVSSSYSIITVILAFIFFDEVISSKKITAIVFVAIGTFFTVTEFSKIRHIHKAKGVTESFVSMLLWGVYFFVVSIASRQINYLSFFTVSGILNGIMMILFSAIMGGKTNIKESLNKENLFVFGINSILYSTAWLSLSYGMATSEISVLAPISSLYPAVTVVLSVAIYKEKLSFSQKAGIAAILAGIYMLGTI